MMKIFAVFFEDNLAAVRRLCDGKTRLNSVMETCITASVSLSPSSEKFTKIRKVAKTIAMRIFVENVSPL